MKQAKGRQVFAITNGTGIFPFFDFLDFYFYWLGEAILRQTSGLSGFKEMFGEGFSISVHSAFESCDAFYEADFMSKLVQVSQHEKSPSKFSITVRTPRDNQKILKMFPNIGVADTKFDRDYLRSKIVKTQEKALVCLCGSPPFTNSVLRDLKELGFSREEILLI